MVFLMPSRLKRSSAQNSSTSKRGLAASANIRSKSLRSRLPLVPDSRSTYSATNSWPSHRPQNPRSCRSWLSVSWEPSSLETLR